MLRIKKKGKKGDILETRIGEGCSRIGCVKGRRNLEEKRALGER